MLLKNLVALVTGAGSGIGRAAALEMAREGARVGVLDSSDNGTALEVEQGGGQAISLRADVSDDAQMRAAVGQLVDRFGRLDVVFANAGINGVWAPLDDLAPDEWDRTLRVNLRGTFLTVKHAVPHLRRNGGAIVITASVNGTRVFSNTGATAYACSKAAQVAFCKMTALELAKDRIRVNVVCPGAIETNIERSTEKRKLDGVGEPAIYPEGAIPLTDGRPGSADDVARLVVFLSSDAARHITGTEIYIDGAGSLLTG